MRAFCLLPEDPEASSRTRKEDISSPTYSLTETTQEEAKILLDDAITHTESAIEVVKKIDDEAMPNELLKCICVYNLAYYLAERKNGEDIPRAKILIEDIGEAAKKFPRHAENWLDTKRFVDQAYALWHDAHAS